METTQVVAYFSGDSPQIDRKPLLLKTLSTQCTEHRGIDLVPYYRAKETFTNILMTLRNIFL